MSKYEVSSCINEYIFDFSSYYAHGKNKREALEDYIDFLIDELRSVNIDKVLSQEDGEIWEVQND